MAAAVAAIASCAKVETVSTSPMQEIAFKTYNPGMTKVTPGYTVDDNLVMGVSALWTKSDLKTVEYFNNVKFEKDPEAANWVTNPKQYWPNTGKLTFAAYAPYYETAEPANAPSVTTSITDDKVATITFLTPAEGNVDFVYGEKLYTSARTANDIAVQLMHAGTRVTFKIGNKSVGYQGIYQVNSIELKNVSSSGTVTVNYADGSAQIPTFKPSKAKQENISIKKAVAVTDVAAEYGSAFLIPDGVNENKQVFTVNYSIKAGKDYIECEPITFTNALGADAKWEQGKNYVFNIIFTADEITFTPEVKDWVEVGPTDVTVEPQPQPQL